MGIDYSGGMLVGTHGSNICEPDDWDEDENGDFWEHLEELGIESYPEHYDAGRDDSYYGFPVRDIEVEQIDSVWINDIRKLSEEFESITGEKASLIGTHRIW